MTIKHMKIFLAVYHEGNITRAAEQLHMTQPAVSRSIQEIEQYYGICLFERINRRLFVTETGKQVYHHALHIVDSFDQMEKGIRNWDTFGILRVGSSITLGNFALPDLISNFSAQHPHIRTQINICNGEQLQQALLNNKLDVALIEGGITESDLIYEPFYSDRLVLIVPDSHPLLLQETVRMKDVVQYDLLLREQGSTGRTLLDSVFLQHGLLPKLLWESVSTQAIIKAVSKGIGISILPDRLVEQDLAAKTVFTREIADEHFRRTNYIVRHKNKYMTNAIEAFCDLCHEMYREST